MTKQQILDLISKIANGLKIKYNIDKIKTESEILDLINANAGNATINLPTQAEVDFIFGIAQTNKNYTKVNEISLGAKAGVVSYANDKGWLFVNIFESATIKVFDVNNNYNEVMSISNTYDCVSVTPDAKKIVTKRKSNQNFVDIYELKADESGYNLIDSIDCNNGMFEVSIDGEGKTIVISVGIVDKVYIYELDMQDFWIKTKEYNLTGADGGEISKDGDYILVKGQSNPRKIYEIKKENGVWGDLNEVITAPNDSSNGFVAGKLELAQDKQILYAGDVLNSVVANEAGRVYVYYKDIDGVWQLMKTIDPPTNNANQKFGFSVASNSNNSKIWVSAIEAKKVYEFEVQG
jgi:hypothetical protein